MYETTESRPRGHTHAEVAGQSDTRGSTRATCAPTIPASDVVSIRSSAHGLRRPITRRLAHDIQAYQRNRHGAASSTEEILSWADSQVDWFRGLTPPPLPSVMLPTKKRPLGEILDDEEPPARDKMTEEIDKLANEAELTKPGLVASGSSRAQSSREIHISRAHGLDKTEAGDDVPRSR